MLIRRVVLPTYPFVKRLIQRSAPPYKCRPWMPHHAPLPVRLKQGLRRPPPPPHQSHQARAEQQPGRGFGNEFGNWCREKAVAPGGIKKVPHDLAGAVDPVSVRPSCAGDINRGEGRAVFEKSEGA